MAILAVAAALLILLTAIQLALPPIVAHRVESELTKHGGHARVHLSALPAPRLLFKEGDSLKVRATGLVTPAPDPSSTGTLSDLDGFDSVDIQVIGMHAGPLTISRLTLQRDDAQQPYRATVQATVTGADLAAYAGGAIGGGIGGFLGGLAGTAMPGSGTEIPIDLGATLVSDGGRVRATTVSGSVAGVPAGPFVEALAAALAGRF
ncbi:MAG TPA: LmeA family phospholipid-binding protein [Thermoleophilaceae bacterium]